MDGEHGADGAGGADGADGAGEGGGGGTVGVLAVPVGARLVGRRWAGAAAELSAAHASVAAAGSQGLGPDAAVSVARLVRAWERDVADLHGAVADHATALDATVADLAATDEEVARSLGPPPSLLGPAASTPGGPG